MLVSNISNQQTQPNFNGNILTQGVNLPKRALKAVNEIYSKKTTGMPDAILVGERQNGILGTFYHSTSFIQSGKDYACILTGDLKEIFKNKTPKQIADMFVKMTKGIQRELEVENLEKELKTLKRKLEATQKRAAAQRKNGDIKMAEMNEAVAARMKSRCETLTGELQKAEEKADQPVKCIGNWIF